MHRRVHAAAVKLFAEKGATQLAVSDLAAAAGIARGTIYNNFGDASQLFEEVARGIVSEMSERMALGFDGVDDRAMRMAIGLRHYVRRAHEEPDWGRFFVRFAFSSLPLRRMWEGGPGGNLRDGMASGRYAITRGQARAALGMIAGAVVSAMAAVLEGELTWRTAGTDAAELVLITLGIDRKEAREIASVPLPPLPALPL